jgi:hypothetical protein
MLPELKKKEAGSLTLYIQKDFVWGKAAIELVSRTRRTQLPGDAAVLAESRGPFHFACWRRNLVATLDSSRRMRHRAR